MTDHMRARYILPIHWNRFIQSEEPTEEPMQRLMHAAPIERIAVQRIGETWVLPSLSAEQQADQETNGSLGD